MKLYNIIPLLVLFICSCANNDDKLTSNISDEESDSEVNLNTLTSQVPTTLYNIDSLVFTEYHDVGFIDELIAFFDQSKCQKSNEVTINSTTTIEEYFDDNYYYLVIKNEDVRKVIYGSEVLNCKALFGELSNTFENSFIWKCSNGCGSAQKETWIEFDYDGNFKYSSNEYLWSDSLSSTVLFKLRNIENEIFAYNAKDDKFWNAYHLNNETTFYDGYNWVFDLVGNEEVRGIYHHKNNDTILINLNKDL